MAGAPDVEHLVVGALCMLVGMLEVVLLVGAAFAIAARRQVRDLGLLAANGGAGPDLRRVLLAQGLVLGAVSSVVGVALGVAAFLEGVPLWERLLGQDDVPHRDRRAGARAWSRLLGSSPRWSRPCCRRGACRGSRPVAALSGRFPVRPGESRAHRGAFVLAGGGLLLTRAAG